MLLILWLNYVCATVSQGMKWSQISHATCNVEFTWREVCTSKATSGCVLFCISWELCFLWLKSFFICTSVWILCSWMMTDYGLQSTCRTTSSCWHLHSYTGEAEMIVWSLSLFQSFWSASSLGVIITRHLVFGGVSWPLQGLMLYTFCVHLLRLFLLPCFYLHSILSS